ncbi:MAG: gliding motility-associated C-terminal domain-containing protein [Chitinophagales bacterium]|nr:gliding motility-associated C-terminal domain-containing protein [Chitinophagales bacterium]MDW8417954.1 gliding motility-associated C-terminal domain-containing protein [Chitinophagales bacterium]
MIRIFTLPLVLLSSFILFAQQTTFRIQYDLAIFDLPGGLAQSTSGSYVLSGTNATLGTVGNLIQISQNGAVQWAKAYSASGISTQFSDVKRVSGGGYVVTGGTGSGCLVARVDANGNVVWANRYRVSASTGSIEYGNRILPTTDGGYVVAGSVERVDPDGAGPIVRQDSSKMFALKIDGNGNLQWMRVFFYTTAYDDDDFLYDVAEVNDGYVFVGSVTMVAGDGHSDAVILKTNTNGALQWAYRWGNSNSEGAYSIISTGTSAVMLSGDDNGRAFLLNLNVPNTGPSVTGTNSLYTTAGFSALGSSLVRTIDGHNTIFGTRIGAIFTPPFLDYSSFILKTNSSSGAVMFSRTYNSGFVSILPVGLQVSDTGYIMNSISATQTPSSYDYGVVKTDKDGLQNSAACAPGSPAFTRSNYSPSLSSFTPTLVTTGTGSSVTLTAINVNPGTSVICLNVACNPPPTPTPSLSNNNVCPGTPVTLSATGGSNVTYKVYTQPTGGTPIGNAPMTVSPGSTTTYYVEADDNSNPGCVSQRASITLTVIQPPSSVGNITGSNAPCLGNANYSITAAGATSYNWSVSGGGTITSGQNTPNITINWTSSGGPYTVSVVVANACGSVSRTLQVNVVAGVSNVSASANPNPVCVGGTLTLVGSGNGVNTWSWSGPNGFTSNSQSPQITNVTPANAGTYNLTASSACGSGSASVTVTVNNVPQNVSASANPSTACVGNTINLTGSATNATSWSWSGPNGFTANTQNTSITNVQLAATGTYTLTAGNACGNSTASVQITVNAAPISVNATANPSPVCAGGTLTLGGGAVGATSYSWSGPNNYTSNQLNNTITNFQQINAGTYTLTALNACGSSQSSVLVNLATAPTNVTANATSADVCANSSISLLGNANGASSFSWTGPNGFSSSLQNPVIANATPADSGLYTLTATNACGSASATVNVDVDIPIQSISVSANPNDTVCAGANIQLQAAGNSVDTWAWAGPNGFTSALPNPAIPNVTLANSGTYTVTASNACGSQSAGLQMLVNNTLGNITASSAVGSNVCAGGSISLIASGSGVNHWQWSGPGGFSSNLQNPVLNPVYTVNSGTYTVTATNACGVQTASVSVQVDTTITAISVNAAPDDTVCAGSTVSFSATGSNVSTWLWNGPGGFTSSQSSVTLNNVNPSNSGTYNVIGSNACNALSAFVSLLVQSPLQNISATATQNGSVCSGSALTLSASGSGVSSWSWSGPHGFQSSLQNPVIVPITLAGSGTYTVTATNACGSQTASVSVQVDTFIHSLTALASPNDTICVGGTLQLNGNGVNVDTWNWSGPGGFQANQQNATINNAQPSATGTYVLTATNACGSVNTSVYVYVKNVPALPAVINGNPSPCGNTAAVYNAAATGDATSYTWALSGGGSITAGQGTPNVTITWGGTAGIYTVSVTANNECGNSPAATLQVVVDVPTVLSVTAADDTICYGQNTTLTALVTPAGTTVNWWSAPAGGTLLGTGNTFTTDTLTQTTIFYAEAVSTGGCSNLQGRVHVTVTVRPRPVVQLTSDHPGNIIFQNEVLVWIAVPDTFEHYEFYWNGNLAQSDSLHTFAGSNFQDGDSVWVIATHAGCVTNKSIGYVKVVEFPNAFTPNGDGVNDLFLKGYDLVILNRWGQELYRGTDGWDGRFNGKKVSPGTYYYVVQLPDITDRLTTIKGNVLLIED